MTLGHFPNRHATVVSLCILGSMSLGLAACDSEAPVAVDMIGALETLGEGGDTDTSGLSCLATITVHNALDENIVGLQVSYGYRPTEDNNADLVALTVDEIIAPAATRRIQGTLFQGYCGAFNPLRKPIISACRTASGDDCRSDAELSQDGVPLTYE